MTRIRTAVTTAVLTVTPLIIMVATAAPRVRI